MHLLEVLESRSPATRADEFRRRSMNVQQTLDDATVGLIWSGTHGGDVALRRAGEMLQERFKNVKVNFYTGGNYPAPPPIVRQAGEECDVVIGATAD